VREGDDCRSLIGRDFFSQLEISRGVRAGIEHHICMKRRGVILKSVWFLGCAALTAFGVTKENQYQSIFQRNAFGLNLPPILPATQSEMVAPVTVTLTGVSNLGGPTKAFFQITEPGPHKLSTWAPPMTKGLRQEYKPMRNQFSM
jgi:hypothetical protein